MTFQFFKIIIIYYKIPVLYIVRNCNKILSLLSQHKYKLKCTAISIYLFLINYQTLFLIDFPEEFRTQQHKGREITPVPLGDWALH